MSTSVAERGRRIATLRFVAVRLMETAAAWTPTTPELEVKVVLGRHIWDFAQHADSLGKRTFELRLPPQYSLAPSHALLEALDELRSVDDATERLSGLYTAVLPALSRHLESYLADSDPILDQPSRVILERMLSDIGRMRSEAEAAAAEIGVARLPDAAELRGRLESLPLLADQGEVSP